MIGTSTSRNLTQHARTRAREYNMNTISLYAIVFAILMSLSMHVMHDSNLCGPLLVVSNGVSSGNAYWADRFDARAGVYMLPCMHA